MLKILGLCISCLVLGITVGLPTKDIDELIYRLEELKQQNHYDEPYDRFNFARPIVYKGSMQRESNNNINNGGYNVDDDVVLRNLDGFERTLANAYQIYNLGDELNRKRLYLERRLNNFNAHHHLPQQAGGQPPKDQVQSGGAFTQESALNQHQLKRAIDPIGGANLLKRAVDRIGGGNLLKRR
ncbi:uncharacterized protein LOC129575291 isoform X4 [Sitodiplosis mosellana]|uniref:uncharacterized protein LOC129575291 isoform X4 n=1 Tax=Sitodiplosis mosellana TaxID=263140 RepID=UPI0024451C2B|nr:uncharacterized protein LOC129575291 isoform X4 [Sitodiplosis mosellana]XP_055314555.1 uncharacterized protein LOC129575291 isoform X4 [Sitodiplosis mosellana]